MLEQHFFSSLAISLSTIAFTVASIALVEAAGTTGAERAGPPVVPTVGCPVEILASPPSPGWLLLLDEGQCLVERR